MTEDKTTIEVKKTTLDKLKAKGKFGESYNDIIERLLK